jgi:hypothetical protein
VEKTLQVGENANSGMPVGEDVRVDKNGDFFRLGTTVITKKVPKRLALIDMPLLPIDK